MQVSIKRQGTVVVAQIHGELDQHHASGIRENLEIAARQGTVSLFVFDLSDLSFMDSSGIGVLMGTHKTVTALGGKTAVVGGGVGVQKMIQLSGIPRMIPLYSSVEDAIEKEAFK